jgi:hypothetical protein
MNGDDYFANTSATDLCRSVTNSQKYSSSVHLFLDQSQCWRLGPPLDNELPHRDAIPEFSLAKMFEDGDFPYFFECLRDRRVLGVILAHSVLYLSDSSWLSHRWDTRSILFLRLPGSEGLLHLDKPYALLQDPSSTLLVDTKEDREEEIRHARYYRAIATLGLLLLEIELGRKIEYDPAHLTFGLPNVNTAGSTLKKILLNEEITKAITPGLLRAVQGCLAKYNLRETFDSPALQETYYGNVVKHLEDELLQLYQIKLEELPNLDEKHKIRPFPTRKFLEIQSREVSVGAHEIDPSYLPGSFPSLPPGPGVVRRILQSGKFFDGEPLSEHEAWYVPSTSVEP